MMRRGYIRQRKSGPTPDQQKASMVASGIDTSGDHPPLYVDLLNKAGKASPLRERADAIKSLRQDDELVVHDAATLGLDADDINRAMIEIGQRGATLIVWKPEPREYEWTPAAARVAGEMSSLAAEAETVLRSEKHQRASAKGARIGPAKKLVGVVREIALKHWRDPTLSGRQAHAAAVAETGVKFSMRLMQLPEKDGGLGRKMDAEPVLELPRPAPIPQAKVPIKRKPKPKRRKAKRQ
jgi:hypothetical protein